MRRANPQIRRWRLLGVWGLFYLIAQGSGAQTTAPPQAKPAQTATVAANNSKKHPATKAAKKHPSSHTAINSSSHTTKRTARTTRGKKAIAKRGQQGIDSARAREIQDALIRQKYLQGQPSGAWDDATQAAMRRYQADQGWQSKTIPDSRALIRLGLGPSSDHLLNPESAMTAAPAANDPKAAAKQNAPDDNLPKQ